MSDRQTYRKTSRQTERLTGASSQTCRLLQKERLAACRSKPEINRQTNRQGKERPTNIKKTGRKTGGQADRQTGGQKGRQKTDRA